MGKAIKLENGLFLEKKFDRFEPQLVFISKEEGIFPMLSRENEKFKELEKLFDGDIKIFCGKFRKNLKGTKIWDTTQRGELLVDVSWGGSFCSTRGGTEIPDNNFIWKNRRASAGGGCGHTFFIISADFLPKLTEDNF